MKSCLAREVRQRRYESREGSELPLYSVLFGNDDVRRLELNTTVLIIQQIYRLTSWTILLMINPSEYNTVLGATISFILVIALRTDNIK